MKPFFGIDRTTDKKNTNLNCEQFIVCSTNEASVKEFNNALEAEEGILKKASISPFLSILGQISIIVFILFSCRIVGEMLDKKIGLAVMYKTAPLAFWITGICFLVFLFLAILNKRKQKKVFEETSEYSNWEKRMEDSIAHCYNELGVPKDAESINVLSFTYKTKNNQPVITSVCCFNLDVKIFADDENLYICDIADKYAIARNTIKAIRTVNSKILLDHWTKEIPFDQEPYKNYKIKKTDVGIVVKGYNILEFEDDGQLWGIYFPCYELPVFEAITGLKAD